MIFTDWIFFPFFFIVFWVYWAIKSNDWRKAWLLFASAIFYASLDWRFLGLVFVVIVNSYANTLIVFHLMDRAKKRFFLALGIVISVGILGIFKYFNFFADVFAGAFGLHQSIVDIALPVGISFYTFHSISYMIDTYRNKIVPTRNFADVALYILFFPQLVAGPIVRATDLLPQMKERRQINAADMRYNLSLFLLGYFKKAVVADNLVRFVDPVFRDPAHFNASDILIAVLSYSAQIYCDFSGYTDMAIAAAGLLGYTLRPNFNHPYFASNLVEFWRRWHISLSFWLRDYLYVPLGGNRAGALMQARNIMITMVWVAYGTERLGPLWHGAHCMGLGWPSAMLGKAGETQKPTR